MAQNADVGNFQHILAILKPLQALKHYIIIITARK